ncbi:major facilitator superfamily transporter [Sporothrix brasiliensis 5110]|uniref:Major facilitator superfamily transporter n=1 Tax=Sporothrix brasiliensis 5110 TaxID=1398154 RepID=A0A0C2IXC3_9PEZI|nr:major facilitator superfamily transporter [Sporothrix brasiliensis 5110]KIH93776.1 major facilitator superfamily transporter [Sporothrix brasiliensis 5110]
MVQPSVVSAAAAGTSRPRQSSSSAFRPRMMSRSSQGSFHAGDIFPSFDTAGSRNNATSTRRASVGTKYRTLPAPATGDENTSLLKKQKQAVAAPTTLSPPNERGGEGDGHHAAQRDHDTRSTSRPPSDRSPSHSPGAQHDATPLPVRQLGLLALLSLAEQTALNSIGPYLPTMVESFDEVPENEMGLYVGILASTFALAQLATNLFWGYLSDAIGRKPVMLLGSFLLMLCFCAFGFCTRYWQVVVVHVAMGLLNGNAAVVPTCLGEVTDRTNQSSAFTWLPVVYSLGSITGPALGGLLVGVLPGDSYPFLAPNLMSAVLLGLAVVVLAIWFDETLDRCDRRTLPAGLMWIDELWSWCCSLTSPENGKSSEASTPASASAGSPDNSSNNETSPLLGSSGRGSEDATQGGDDSDDNSNTVAKLPLSSKKTDLLKQLLNHKTVLLLLTYLVFQLSNISFNSLYPIFSSAPLPTGRDLPPGMIGLLLSFAGAATIVFQITAFQPLKVKLGNLGTYRGALFGLAVSMLVMPWVPPGHDGKEWQLHVQIGAVLVFKNICAVGGLSSVMLLINNSAPSHETLGTLNGIAQTLSAAGRSIGPFLSGALFSLSTRIQRPARGELLAWYIFGGVAGLGWLLSLVISGRGLESADWEGHAENGDDDNDDNEADEESA